MRIGLILECAPNGPDQQVFEHLITQIAPEAELAKPVTLGNKKNLLEGCGAATAGLIRIHACDLVLIIWDLYPAWKEDGDKPNMSEDRKAVTKSLIEENIAQCLKEAKVDTPAVRVLCIDKMLETWLHVDGGALTDAISFRSRKPIARIRDNRHAQRIPEPKQHLDKLYREHCYKPYTDHVHALDIIRRISELGKLACCPSFKRFVDLLV